MYGRAMAHRRCSSRHRRAVATLAALLLASLFPSSASAVLGGVPEPVGGFVVSVLREGDSYACTGVIIDATHVLTHETCTNRPAWSAAVVAGSTVRADVSGVVSPGSQIVEVAARQTHPRNLVVANESRIGVLTLATPLTFDAQTYPVTLPAAGVYPPTGTVAHMAGFGSTSPTTANPGGVLYGLDSPIVQRLTCGGADRAVTLCTRTPAGSGCSTDLGMPLTVNGVLIGLHSSGTCAAGATDFWVNIAAPEILQFIQGNPNPPIAPRVGASNTISVPLAQTRQVATCNPSTLTVPATTVTFQFLTTAGGLLQDSASPTYVIGKHAVGATLTCREIASNDGGTLIDIAGNTIGPIALAPPPVLTVQVTRSPKKVKRGKTLTIAYRVTASEPVERLEACLSGPRAVLKRQRCTRAPQASAGFTASFKVKVPRKARTGTKTFTLMASVPDVPVGRAKVKVKVVR